MTGRRRQLAWLAAAAVMFAVPFAFNLARSSRFSVTITLYPRAVGPYPPRYDANHYRDLLNDSALRSYMRLTVGARSYVFDGASFRAQPHGVSMTIEADTPARGSVYAHALGLALADASRVQVAAEAAIDIKRLRASLASAGLPAAERRSRARRLAAARRVADAPFERVLVAPAPPPPRPTRWADRLADFAPGGLRPRPNPLWAGLAGVLLVGLAAAVRCMLRPPRRRSAAPPPP